ncbi:unnamed protein product [Euphydryas editha]|uniref:THAP-type domain-containing protein n=1 Tax=Euphydryas editha TaxID=104508 RepID=A0AAU9UFT9_EUPED|nr:unnamed protein product [Euphydryas editha]
MFRHCCVPKCETQRQDAKFHRFPVRKEICDKWLRNIGSEELLRMDNLVNKAFVCHKHFEKRFVSSSDRLKIGAVPTLFTEFEIISGNPATSSTLENEIPTSSDHTYCLNQHQHDYTYCARLEDVTNVILGMDYMQSTESAITVDVESSTTVTLDIATPVATERATVMTPENPRTSSLNVLECTPQRYGKKRLVRDVKSLTPKCKLLYLAYKKTRRENNFLSRAKKAISFNKEVNFEKLTKNMNPLAKKFLWMQVKLCMKPKKGRRFTMNEKLIGLAIYKQSPKSYRFLQKMFILPSETTLKAMISHLNIGAGINSQIFELIKEQVRHWNEQKKICTIMFDEMALEAAVTYDSKQDKIDGFVHLNEKTRQFADHALVFMLRGAVYKWQQPIAFYFCEGQTKMIDLKAIIKSITAAVTETGLRPIALVSDQGSSFQSAIKDLIEETKGSQLRAGVNVDGTIHLSGNVLSVFYDPPHLIKGMRNNFLSKNVIFEGKIAKWQDIVDVYNMDCRHGESRLMHKLTDEHVIPSKIKKMKVKNCVRVFSKTVVAAMSYTSQFPLYPDGKPVSKTMKDTSKFISFMDDLFDSVNGAERFNKKNVAKPLRQTMEGTTEKDCSPLWNLYQQIVSDMKVGHRIEII